MYIQLQAWHNRDILSKMLGCNMSEVLWLYHPNNQQGTSLTEANSRFPLILILYQLVICANVLTHKK